MDLKTHQHKFNIGYMTMDRREHFSSTSHEHQDKNVRNELKNIPNCWNNRYMTFHLYKPFKKLNEFEIVYSDYIMAHIM